MLSIDADNRAAERCIGKIAELARARGASFSPQLTLRCRNGELSVAGPQTGESGYLMNLPQSCLIPLRQFPFASTGDEITVSAAPDADPELAKLAEAMAELYNLTGKLAAHKSSSSSWSFIAAHPALASVIVAGRNGPSVRALAERVVKGETPSLALDTFIKSRVITVGDGQQSEVALMPVGDFLNHAFQAPGFEFPANGVVIRRFSVANDECVVCYGPYDAFDTWLTYSFADTQAPVIRSVPLEISLPVGRIVVNGHIQHGRSGALPPQIEDLRLYIPGVVAPAQGGIAVDYLLIPGKTAPLALRRVLGLLIAEMQPGARLETLIAMAEVQVIEKNIAYYKSLQSVLKNLVLKDAAWKPVADNLAGLCALHLSRLGEYAANRGF